MTAQAMHRVHLADGRSFLLCAVSDRTELFEPCTVGLHTVMAGTACHRGYVCGFRIQRRHLVLDQLAAQLDDDDPLLRWHEVGPFPGARERRATLFNASWDHLRLPVRFTGGLLLGKDQVDSLYRHGGTQPAWTFAHVCELVLEEGQLMEQRALDDFVAEFRVRHAALDQAARRMARGRPADPPAGPWGERFAELEQWVERSLPDRSYDFPQVLAALQELPEERTKEYRKAKAQARAEQRREQRRAAERPRLRDASLPLLARFPSRADGARAPGNCPLCGAATELRLCDQELVMCFPCYLRW